MAEGIEKYCVHLQSMNQIDRLRSAHLSVRLKSSPVISRAQLDETVFLCSICAGLIFVIMNRLEKGALAIIMNRLEKGSLAAPVEISEEIAEIVELLRAVISTLGKEEP